MKKLVTVSILILTFFSCLLYAENHIRAVKIKYLVYNYQTGTYDKEIEAIDGYEVLPRVKMPVRIKPIAIFQNVASSEELEFYFSIRIFNDYENKELFSQNGWLNRYLLASPGTSGIQYVDASGNNLPFPTPTYKNGLPPGGYAKVTFNEIVLYDTIKYHHGSFTVSAFSNNLSYSGNKPFPGEYLSDDTVRVWLKSVKLTYLFQDRGDNYVKYGNQLIPDPKIWFSTGVEVVDGTKYCYSTHNSVTYPVWDTIRKKLVIDKQFAPVYRMNRVDLDGQEYQKGKRSGDILLSQIMEYNNPWVGMLFLYQRLGKQLEDFRRGWSDTRLFGPEQRVFQNGVSNHALRNPDELKIEFVYVSYDSAENLLNIPEEKWTTLPRKAGLAPVVDNSLLSIFGGGGKRIGYSESWNNDSALTFDEGLRIDSYDDGKDKYFLPGFVNFPQLHNQGLIRIRIRIDAEDNTIDSVVKDDFDDFFIDDILWGWGCGCGTFSINNIEIEKPYSVIPEKLSMQLPVSVICSDADIYGSLPTIYMTLRIKPKAIPDWPSLLNCYHDKPHSKIDKNDFCGVCGEYVNQDNSYYSENILCFVDGNQSNEILKKVDFPKLDLTKFSKYLHPGLNEFEALAMTTGSIDHYDMDYYLYTEFSINLGDVIAYDPPDGKNDVPEFSGINNRGLNMFTVSSGEYNEDAAFGMKDGSGSGEIAMKFELSSVDTIYGFQAWFENRGLSNDISFTVHENNNGLPGKPVPNATMYKIRGLDGLTKKSVFSAYSTYFYDKPLILQPGTYWAAVAQLGDNGFELGGSAAGMGMVTTVVDTAYNGDWCSSQLIDNNFRSCVTDSFHFVKNYVNDTVFAYLNAGREWRNFTPNLGNPAFGHLDRMGRVSTTQGGTKTYSRGSFIPMLRIYMNGSHYDWKSVKESVNGKLNLLVNPNPASQFSIINYQLPNNGITKLSVYDMLGQEMAVLLDEYQEAGSHNYQLLITNYDLQAGVYFVKLTSGGMTQTQKLIVFQ